MGEITFKTRQSQKDLTVVHYDSPLNVAQAKQALLEENTRWIGALQEEGSSIRVDGDQQLKPGSSYILTMRDQPGREEEVVSFWAKPYRQKLQALPAPNEFSTVLSAFQTPQGNLGDEVEFDKHGPLLNIYRPPSAKAWPNR
ncbi:TPA: hypothetical protein ACH3X3_008178 [Trebouxia sp. C0006]